LIIQGDSLARGPKLVYLQIFNKSVNQLTDDELTTGYYQQDGATCHTSNASMREIEKFFTDRIISKKPLATQISQSNACQILSLGPIEGQSVQQIHPAQLNNSKTLYAKRFKPSTSTLWAKYSRIWRKAFKCAWMWKETSFSIGYEQVLFCIVADMCI